MGQRLGVPKTSSERQLYRKLLKYVADIKVDTSEKVHFYLRKDEVPNIKTQSSFPDVFFEAKKCTIRISPITHHTKYLCVRNRRVSVRRSNRPDEITWNITSFKDTRGRYLKSSLEHEASGAFLTSTKRGKVILMGAPGNDFSYFKLIKDSNTPAIRMNLLVHGYQDWYLFFDGRHKVVYKDDKGLKNLAGYEFDIYDL